MHLLPFSSKLIFTLCYVQSVLTSAIPSTTSQTIEPRAASFPFQDHISPSYTRPSRSEVNQILAVGDSFTAGVGSNGSPQLIADKAACSRYGSAWPIKLRGLNWSPINGARRSPPHLTFGACSGHLLGDLLQYQLKQGEAALDPSEKFTNIGKPDIAVLTISGNDLGFSSIVMKCFLGIQIRSGDCDRALASAAKKVRSTEFRDQLSSTYQQIWLAGRDAAGARPAQAFQVFVAGYIQFSSVESRNCDNTRWGVHGSKLTLELRKKMNDLVTDLNTLIEAAAAKATQSGAGVFYVDGMQSLFNGHRFCEADASGVELSSPTGGKVWFWHTGNDHSKLVTKGDPNSYTDVTSPSVDVMKVALDKHIPSKAKQAAIFNSSDPSAIDPMFKNQETLERSVAIFDDSWRRLFHPKGSGYAKYAQAFLDRIARERPRPGTQGSPAGTS